MIFNPNQTMSHCGSFALTCRGNKRIDSLHICNWTKGFNFLLKLCLVLEAHIVYSCFWDSFLNSNINLYSLKHLLYADEFDRNSRSLHVAGVMKTHSLNRHEYLTRSFVLETHQYQLWEEQDKHFQMCAWMRV